MLQKKIVTYLVIYAAVVAALVFVLGFFNAEKNENLRKMQLIERDINSQNQKMTDLNQKIKEIKDANEIWQTLSSKTRNAQGLRIDAARRILKDLESFLQLPTPINVNLSPPKELSSAYKTNGMSIVSSDVVMKFDAFSDEIIFNLVNNLMKHFPGFIQIQSFKLNKTGQLNTRIINQIEQGDKPALVKGEMTIQWRDFKEDDDEK